MQTIFYLVNLYTFRNIYNFTMIHRHQIKNAPVMDALFILKYNYIEKRSDTDYEP